MRDRLKAWAGTGFGVRHFYVAGRASRLALTLFSCVTALGDSMIWRREDQNFGYVTFNENRARLSYEGAKDGTFVRAGLLNDGVEALAATDDFFTGATIGYGRELVSTQSFDVPRKVGLVDRLSRQAPRLCMDIQRKLGFVVLALREFQSFQVHYDNTLDAFRAAEAAGNQAGQEDAASTLVRLMAVYLDRMSEAYITHRAALQTQLMRDFRGEFEGLRGAEQSRVETFYARLETVAGIFYQVFEVEVPPVLDAEDLTLSHLNRWLEFMVDALGHMVQAVNAIKD